MRTLSLKTGAMLVTFISNGGFCSFLLSYDSMSVKTRLLPINLCAIFTNALGTYLSNCGWVACHTVTTLPSDTSFSNSREPKSRACASSGLLRYGAPCQQRQKRLNGMFTFASRQRNATLSRSRKNTCADTSRSAATVKVRMLLTKATSTAMGCGD